MKIKLCLICFVLSFRVSAGDLDKINFHKPLSQGDLEKIANKIYQIEGGEKTKYPYGIKAIDTKGDEKAARRICINTIRNNQKRWQQERNNKYFLDYLADKYCPPSADKKGNINWKKNIRL